MPCSSGRSRGASWMADKPSGLVQGTLDMLILKTLELEPMHGYGIAMRIEQISKGVFQVNPGSLFPAFRRLERAGWLASEWRETENNRRAKYYALTFFFQAEDGIRDLYVTGVQTCALPI